MISIIKNIYFHPLNKDRRFKAVARFIWWQIVSRTFKHPVLLPFTDKTKYLCWNGLTGLTGNYYHGLMEMEEMAFVLHYLDKDDTFYDIGANVGAYTILTGLHIGCQTVSFEPHPKTFSYLERNISLGVKTDNITLFNIGLGSKAGRILFTSDKDTVNHVALNDAVNVIDVQISVLDELTLPPPTVIKIDVEGFEWEVLNGGKLTLENGKLQAIIIELNGSGRRYGFKDEDIDILLKGYGFKPYTYDPFNRELISLDNYTSHNTIYIRNSPEVSGKLKKGNSVRLSNGAVI
jgi:FkbM family methyltransferase